MPAPQSSMIPKLLVVIAIAAVATGIALAMTKPWIEDVPELKTADFAKQMNELIGVEQNTPDIGPVDELGAKLRDALTELDMKFMEAIEEADSDPDQEDDFLTKFNHPDMPGNALVFIHENPPRSIQAARATLAELRTTAGLNELQELLTRSRPPRAWLDAPAVSEQFSTRTTFSNRQAIKILAASSRLSQLEGNIPAALDALDSILSLSRTVQQESLLISFMISRSYKQRVADELRLMALERTLDLPAFNRAEAMLASISHDDASWKELTHRIVAAERLFGLATMREWLEEKKLNSKTNRRKVMDMTRAMHTQFIEQMLASTPQPPPAQDLFSYISNMAGDEEQSIDEILQGSHGMMQNVAHGSRNSRAYLAAVRHLVAIEHARLKHGTLPASLDEIDATYFQAPLPDRGTLTYRPDVSAGIYTLYTFGSDGQDNGGNGIASSTTSRDEDCVLTQPRAGKPAENND